MRCYCSSLSLLGLPFLFIDFSLEGVSMDLTFLSGAAGFAGNLVNNAVQYYTQKNQQRQAQSNERKNMQLQSELEQQGYYNNIVRTPQALRDAGLNPAAATGMNIAAPSVSHSGNSQSVGMQSNAADIVNNAILSQSQKDLNEAAAKKANAEAKSTEIKNRREEHLDSALSNNMQMILGEMRDSTDNPFMRAFLDSFLDSSSDKMNLGDYDAFNKMWFDLSQKERDRELNFIQTEFDKKVLSMQYDNGSAAAIADLPKAKRYEIYAAINQMNANVARLNAETSLTEDERAKLRAEVSKLGQEVQSLFHHDPAAMYKAGDAMSLLVSLGFDAVKAASAGAGFAAGARFAGAGSAGAAGASKGLSMPKFGSRSANPSVMPTKVFEGIKKSAAEIAKGDKVYEAKLIDASVRRWKAQQRHK